VTLGTRADRTWRPRLEVVALTLLVQASAVLVAAAPVAANAGYPPACRTSSGAVIVRDYLTEHRSYAAWDLTLLDTLYMVPSSYAPNDLTWVGKTGISGSGSVRRFVLLDLQALDRAARVSGIRLRVVSAYRSHARQKDVFNYWVSKSGYPRAIEASARAGHSEHQLGTTIDFSFVGGKDPWYYADFGATKAGAWLRNNAWRYGWVMSYPKGAQQHVCYRYEPWHYRYVGRAMAAEQRSSGLVPRYWLWRRG
jgi:D-alanyl-D-alanine carboxypeptidase